MKKNIPAHYYKDTNSCTRSNRHTSYKHKYHICLTRIFYLRRIGNHLLNFKYGHNSCCMYFPLPCLNDLTHSFMDELTCIVSGSDRQTASAGFPSLPALAISCQYYMNELLHPQWYTRRTSGISVPIPNATVHIRICMLLSSLINIFTICFLSEIYNPS